MKKSNSGKTKGLATMSVAQAKKISSGAKVLKPAGVTKPSAGKMPSFMGKGKAK